MVRLGGTATNAHLKVFQGLEKLFRARGLDLDWVLYSDYDTMVDAFVSGEIDMAWNGPLGYVKTQHLLSEPCQVIAMRDVDINFMTHFITGPNSEVLTVEDLKGRSFAFGRRSSEQAGLLPYYFLKQVGIDPRHDLGTSTFFEDREATASADEVDVVNLVRSGEYDAGAVSQKTLETMAEQGELARNMVRIFWSSPGYSHCCFTAQGNMDPQVSRTIEEAFLSVDYGDPLGKSVLDAEGCKSFVPGVSEGWEIIEAAAIEEGLI